VDDRRSFIVGDNTDLQRPGSRRRVNEHRDTWIVGLECSPVVS
jgi:hypothetical protein